MDELSIVALFFYIASGILLSVAGIVLVMGIREQRRARDLREEELIVLDDVMLIHTNESIEPLYSQTTDIQGK